MSTQQKIHSSSQRPILVTGAHRTGTTWVGKMLAVSPEVAYISEPLNLWHRPGVMNTPVEYWYSYISNQNEDRYLPALQDTLAFHYHVGDEILALRSFKDALRMGRDWSRFTKGKIRRQRPLLKDPFAVFSAPWFAQKLGCKVIITVRHPAAVASSLKRLNWSFDFENILQQPLLMTDWLEPYQDKMIQALDHPADVIGQSSLLWLMIYQTVERFRQMIPKVSVIRHEDLSLDPVDRFGNLYKTLGIPFTTHVKTSIQKSSSPKNPKELSTANVHAVRLNSQASIHNWKERLSSDEIERVHALTVEAASPYYSERDWE